jgi:hypothetical protein
MDRWDRVAVTVSLAYVTCLLALATSQPAYGVTGWRFWLATGVEVVNCTAWLVRTDRRIAAETRRLRSWGQRTGAARDR